MTTAPRLRIVGLHSALAGPFDLELGAGECLAITGPSGSGKSLFLRMVADLDPSQGEVFLDGVERRRMPAPAWRRQVVYNAAEPGWWREARRRAFPWRGRWTSPARWRHASRLRRRCWTATGRAAFHRRAPARGADPRPGAGLARAAARRADGRAGRGQHAALVEAVLRERLAAGVTIAMVTHSAAAGGATRPPAPAHGEPPSGAGMNPILLTPFDIAIAAVLIVLDGVLSLVLRLGLHRQLAWAATRMVVQLVLIGFVLRIVFAIASPLVDAGGGGGDGGDRRARGGGAPGTAARPLRQLRGRRHRRSPSPPS